MSFGHWGQPAIVEAGGKANRVSQSVTPNLDQPAATFDSLKHTVDDLKNSIAGLNQALLDARLRERAATDWARTYLIDTSSAIPTSLVATKETGGRPFNSLSIVNVGGGNLTVRINGDRAINVSVGDKFVDEIIWSVEIVPSTTATGTAQVRLGAYAGR